ncbi:MAG: hypothetical protein KJ072_27015 [Verrucomicrobia bacterium]|nr:hypothetical protein [Verrucomicrobiota bacterium]
MAGVAVWVPGGHELMADEVDPPSTVLTGVWAPRREFEAAGVAPFAVLNVEGWGNVAGGLERGDWWNILLDFGFELDTAKLGWWEGGRFMVQAHWVVNRDNDSCFEDYTGAFNPASGVMAGDRVVAGRLGQMLEPAIAPLGYDWKIGVGIISSFAAREESTASLLDQEQR